MQQHSQIVELKDRLVQALDEHFNVKNLEEVKRIVATLEKSNVTLEDLERTRLGKYINELRRKTEDKELAKRAKKLIKSWRQFSVGPGVNVHSSSTTPNAALTSPFNPHSAISPRSLSSDSLAFNSNYAPSTASNGYTNRNSVLSPNGNSHPALLRIKNQHTSLSLPHEKSKPSSGQLVSPSQSSKLSPSSGGGLRTSFRPHSQTASPRDSTSQVNGHLKPSSAHQRSHSNLTSPVNAPISALSGKNGLSPGLLRNSFKNILGKDGTSPSNSNSVRRRTTPPMVSSIIKPDSAPSSRHCSPLAFSFSNDSRDSASLQSHKSSYSNQGEYSSLDTNDEDSNSSSSVFSSLSNDGAAAYNSRSLLDSPNANHLNPKRNPSSRKRKLDSETDSLRDNLNSIINSGSRRLQSTQELVQKFNLNLGNSSVGNHNNKKSSLSASSSPGIDAKRAKLTRNGTYKNGFHHLDENSLDHFESTIHKKSHINNKSLPASPALLSLRNNAHSATTSPVVLSRHSYEDDDDDERYSKASSVSKRGKSSALPSPDDSVSFDFAKAKQQQKHYADRTTTDIDRDIKQIYQQLPPINPIDAALMEDFKFDPDEVDAFLRLDADEPIAVKVETIEVKEEKMELDENEDEYELFEYTEEYEEEEVTEVEVTDDEYYSAEDEAKSEPDEEEEVPLTDTRHDFCVHSNSTGTEALTTDDMAHREHTIGDISNCDNPTAVDTGSEAQGTDLKSPSAAVTSDTSCGVAATADSVHDQVMEEFQPDSTNTCDDSNDAIPSSTTTSLPLAEADSTTTLYEEADHQNDEASSNSNSHEQLPLVDAGSTGVEQTTSVHDSVNSLYNEEDFYDDIELLNYFPSEVYLLEEFPSLAHFQIQPPPIEQLKETPPTVEAEPQVPPPSTIKDPPPVVLFQPKVESPSPMETSDAQGPATPSPPSDDDEDEDEDDDDELSDSAKLEPEPQPTASSPQVEIIPKAKRKRTKRVLMPVLKKKYRKCVARSRVKRKLVDKIANEEWEFVNGTYDKDGDWREFGEMTSTYVLRGGENASNLAEENVLRILPYASFSW